MYALEKQFEHSVSPLLCPNTPLPRTGHCHTITILGYPILASEPLAPSGDSVGLQNLPHAACTPYTCIRVLSMPTHAQWSDLKTPPLSADLTTRIDACTHRIQTQCCSRTRTRSDSGQSLLSFRSVFYSFRSYRDPIYPLLFHYRLNHPVEPSSTRAGTQITPGPSASLPYTQASSHHTLSGTKHTVHSD